MEILMILAIAAVVLAAAAAFEIYREVHSFTVTHYNVTSPRLKGLCRETKVLFLSDLHNRVYGRHNERLLQAVREEKPDLILIGGDMLVGKPDEPFDTALEFVSQLPSICPVYYANGNHEGRMKEEPGKYGNAYTDYRKALEKCGIRLLENDIAHLNLNGQKTEICGLEFPVYTYRKFHRSCMDKNDIADYLSHFHTSDDMTAETPGKVPDQYTILLAHNPAYMDAYLEWGADLVLSGHLHGGLVRIPGLGGIVTPQGFFFPKYSGEMTREGEQTVIVSRGLGSHTLNIRLFNVPELISIHLIPASKNSCNDL